MATTQMPIEGVFNRETGQFIGVTDENGKEIFVPTFDAQNRLVGPGGAVLDVVAAQKAGQRAGNVIDIRDWNGFDNTGANSNDSIVAQWFTQGMGSGLKLYAPPGIIAMDSGVSISVTGDIEVDLPRGAVFKSTENLATSMIEFKDNGGSHRYGLTWLGGGFNNALGVFVEAEASNTCIAMTRLRRVLIERVKFTGAPDYVTASTTTDTAIAGVDNREVTISRNFFSGQGDACIYLGGNSSAGSSDDGGEITIALNHFTDSQQAFTYKRGAEAASFIGNTMRRMYSGVSAFEADTVAPPREMTIANNVARYLQTSFVRLHGGSDHKVIGNTVVDFGYLPDGTTVSAAPHAVRVMGASNTVVSGNTFKLDAWRQGDKGSTGHAAIVVSQYTYTGPSGAVTNTPDRVDYNDNTFANVYTAVREDNSGMGPTFGNANRYVNVNTRLTATNALSAYNFHDASQGHRYYVGTTEQARVFGVGVLASRLRNVDGPHGITRMVKSATDPSITWGSLAPGAAGTPVNITIAGVVPTTDVVFVWPRSAGGKPDGLIVEGLVTAADTVQIRARNVGSTTLNMTSAYEYSVTVVRFS